MRSSGGDPGCAGAWGFDERERERRGKKISLKLSTGSGHVPQNMDLVGGLAVVPVKNNFGHQFIPKWDLQMPLMLTWDRNIEFKGSGSFFPN